MVVIIEAPLEWSSLHVGGQVSGMSASSGAAHEPLATKTLGKARRRGRTAETRSAQVQYDVQGQLGHRDGVRCGKAQGDCQGAAGFGCMGICL